MSSRLKAYLISRISKSTACPIIWRDDQRVRINESAIYRYRGTADCAFKPEVPDRQRHGGGPEQKTLDCGRCRRIFPAIC